MAGRIVLLVTSPRVPALIAAEFPIIAVEATLAAVASFTLIGPLGFPWWAPLACIAGTVALSDRSEALRRNPEVQRAYLGT